jgi:two-component system, cell cycle sensor histidine kinase and response regulator CckA
MTSIDEKQSVQLRLQMLEARLRCQQTEIRRLEGDRKLYADLFNAIGAAVFILDPQHRFLDINLSTEELLGTTASAVRGQHCYSVLHCQEKAPVGCPLNTVLDTRQYASGPMYVESIDRHLWVSCTPVFNEVGEINKVIHIADDITELVRMRDQVTASEKRLRAILDALPDMILETDTAHKTIWANRAALVENPDIIGNPCYTAFNPVSADTPCEACVCREAIKSGQMSSRIYHHPGRPEKSGEAWWHNIGIPLKDSQGKITRLIEFSRNITQDMIARRDLEASERQFRLLAENSEDIIWTLGADARLIYINPAVERLLGYRPGELVDQPLSKVLMPDDYERALTEIQAFLERLAAGERDDAPLRMEVVSCGRDGQRIITEAVVNKVFDQRGAFRFFTGISRDITERQRREEALRQAHKLEAVGVLAGGLAHDFNNLLSIILGNLEITGAGGPIVVSPPSASLNPADFVDQLDPHLQAAREATLRARDLTHQLLAFAKGSEPVKQFTQLEPVLAEALSRCTAGKQVVTQVVIDPDLQPIAVDRRQMERAVSNIIENAVEAMPDGGELTITARPHRLSSRDPVALLSENRSHYLKLTFRDQGCGIPPDVRAKIFDPYFTTKPLGAKKGLGLGLTLAYAVVKRHGGWIDVDSLEGQGSCVTILLPMESEPAPTPLNKFTPAATHRILLMDDEEQLRVLCEQMLAHLGYEVQSVADGHAAVSAYRQAMDAGNPFGLVILDLTVKFGPGGKDTLRELRRLHPDVLAVVSSGYDRDPVMTNPQQFGFTTVLPKPYTLKELTAVLDKILPKPPRTP